MTDNTVLVIDTDAGEAEKYTDMLREKGCNVVKMCDNASGIKYFGSNRPRAVITGIEKYPYTLIDGIRQAESKLPAGQGTYIVLLTEDGCDFDDTGADIWYRLPHGPKRTEMVNNIHEQMQRAREQPERLTDEAIGQLLKEIL